MTIALHSARLNKYVNMPKGGGRLTSTSEKRWEHLPVDWIGPRWRVVWTFDGYMALHNTQSNRFMKVGSDNRMTSSSERTWSWIPNDWNRERFICVDAGDGEIALFHPYTNRFVRMNKDSSMGTSRSIPNGHTTSPGLHERFRVVNGAAQIGETGTRIALHVARYNRFLGGFGGDKVSVAAIAKIGTSYRAGASGLPSVGPSWAFDTVKLLSTARIETGSYKCQYLEARVK